MDSVNNAVNTVLAMRDAQTVDQVQATLLKKVLNMQSQTVATLMQGAVPAMAQDAKLGSRVNTHA